jgi:hypothetical protein
MNVEFFHNQLTDRGLEAADIDEMPEHARSSGHRRADQMGATASALAAFEIAIAGGRAALAGFEAIRVHRQTHRTTRLAPFESGINEDPVTGSAHALVAPYWQKRLQRSRVIGWQCSYRPGGMVCESASSGMIRLTGTGHLLWDGTLNVSVPPWREASGTMVDDGEAAWQHWLAIA